MSTDNSRFLTDAGKSMPDSPEMPTPKPAGPTPIGRIPVLDISPVVACGRWPTKAVVGEAVPISATVFREGHEAVAATLVLLSPDGREQSRQRMEQTDAGLDRWRGWVQPEGTGCWEFRVEGWADPCGTWLHDAPLKVEADVDVELTLIQGALVLERVGLEQSLPESAQRTLDDAVAALRDTSRPAQARLAAATSWPVREVLSVHPLREGVSHSPQHTLRVDRGRALYGSWYEMFPRSEGAYYDATAGRWISGTLRSAAQRLPAIAEMGFDVIYLTPIHPIGTTNRKGRNNALESLATDPGSPYAIGSPDGGHASIDPQLGTFRDFDAFVARATSLGMEVALDLALQASPDHPWVEQHPEWFTTRADGSIAYAENPPKKYEDIYPLNFDNDPEGIYEAVWQVLQVWIDHGVTAFRVDNPHTKPLTFWQRLLAEMRQAHPEVIFLAEAFTRPAMMHTLGAIGFHQSYTYFAWRNTKDELATYLAEIAGDKAAAMRPSLWPTTHDILTPYMQTGGQSAHAIRAVLAATGSPAWGIYSGYELVENVARPGSEEHIDNEKYEYKPRDWTQVEQFGIARLITMLNTIRRQHAALQQLRNITIHPTTDDATLCFSRHLPAEHSPTGTIDTVIVVVNLDPVTPREGMIELDVAALGMPGAVEAAEETAVMAVHDELSGETYYWGQRAYVRLDPQQACAHVLSVRPL